MLSFLPTDGTKGNDGSQELGSTGDIIWELKRNNRFRTFRHLTKLEIVVRSTSNNIDIVNITVN
jgi:hypothetical protein